MRTYSLLPALLLLALGCGSSSGDDGMSSAASSGTGGTGSTGSTSSAGTGGDATATSGAGGQGAGFEGPGVMGLLRDAAGSPLSNETILVCSSATCFYKQSGSDGRFAFELTPPVDVAVKTEENLSVTPRRGAALVPVQVLGNDPVDVGDVFVCNLPEGAPVGPASQDPQTLSVGDGLELTVNKADLSAPLGFALIDLAACTIPEEHQHPIPGLEGEEILAVYGLHPFSGASDSAMGVRAPSDLPAGTEVNFRTISWLDGHVSAVAKGHADGSYVETDPGEGIYDFTWLVISK